MFDGTFSHLPFPSKNPSENPSQEEPVLPEQGVGFRVKGLFRAEGLGLEGIISILLLLGASDLGFRGTGSSTAVSKQ